MNKISDLLPDLWITIPTILLIIIGILVIYSSDATSNTVLAIYQGIFAIIGLFFYLLISFIDLESTGNFTKILYSVILMLLIVVFLIGFETRGSVRWIPLGPIQIQPSEFAKPILILVLANFWSKRTASFKNIFFSILITLPIFVLIFKQPDLGTALTLVAIWGFILIGTNISLVKVLIMGLFVFILSPITWAILKDYQKSRIISFLFPSKDPLGVGYNVIQSTIAVGSGGIIGRGLGRGTQSRLKFLPEFRTDFIFASYAEEFGLIGAFIVLIFYSVIIGRSLILVSRVQNRFNSLTILGTLGMLFFQIVVNIGMNLGLMPITGITLPLISYGGSSIISILICLGFIASSAKSNNLKGFELS